MESAFRPYRATGFPEESVQPLQEAMSWPEQEWTRRLRKAERWNEPSSISAVSPTDAQRLAPKRREPRRADETWEQAEARAQLELNEMARDHLEDDRTFCWFPDEPIAAPPAPT